MAKDEVSWAELQKGMKDSGLRVSVGIPPKGNSIWPGTIDEMKFIMTIDPLGEDGLRDNMVISLFGQDSRVVIPRLSQFMGYSPFCRYQDKGLDEFRGCSGWNHTGTYEWDCKNPRKRLGELRRDDNFYDIRVLSRGFISLRK